MKQLPDERLEHLGDAAHHEPADAPCVEQDFVVGAEVLQLPKILVGGRGLCEASGCVRIEKAACHSTA